MKKLSLLLLTFVFYSLIKAQTTMSCCVPSATDQFAMNTKNKAFVMAHDEPLPFTYTSDNGHDITYKTSDGKDAHAWMVPAEKPTNYYMFVVHEWWGLNDYIKQQSEKFSKDFDINVIALDLYDNQVAATREDASKLVQTVKNERAMAIIHGAYNYVGKDAKVFTVGWCFGGGWSLQTAIEGSKQAVGCIMFYGQPEKDVSRLKTIQCDIIGFFGNQDQWPSPEVVNQFEKDAKEAGVQLYVHRYDANHAFANPSNPNYNKEATEDAYEKMYAFVRERIKS